MKKLLLFALAAGIGVSAYAQNKFEVKEMKPQAQVSYADFNPQATAPIKKHVIKTPTQNTDNKGTRGEITRVTIGKSGYIWSASGFQQRCLVYNPGLNTIAFIHRGEEGMYPGTSVSSIMTSWSTDGGASFPNNMVVVDDSHNNRYPSGVLYNPAGNTDPSQAYVIVAGPSHTNGNWDNTYFGSARLDNTNANVEYVPLEGTTQATPYLGLVSNDMCSTNNGDVYIVSQVSNQEGTNHSEYDLMVYKGTKGDNDTWTWERNAERIDFEPKPEGGERAWLSCGMAFAPNGSVGYKWAIGRKEGMTNSGLQPVLFSTEDGGTTWTEVPVNLTNNEVMAEYLYATDDNTGPLWPWFIGEIDAVVDANGDLQMFAEVNSHSNSNPDDFYYVYQNKEKLFNITFDKTNGVKSVIFVDSIMGDNVTKDKAGDLCFGTGDNATGWSNRIQASRSEDGMYIAVSWGDTPNADQDFEGFNGGPDLKGTGRHINASKFYKIGEEPNAVVPNFTSEDLYAGNYRYTFAAAIGKEIEYNGFKHLLVPMSGTIDALEWEANNSLAPVTNYLVNVDGLGGVPIPLTEGVNEITAADNTFTVSQNQPNPFTGTTTITVNSNTVAPVSVEVSNIMGQTVFTQNEGTINGSKQITIDASNLQAGIYFYTVRVGAESQTKKMMVK